MIKYATRIDEDANGKRVHARHVETNEQGTPPRVYLELIEDFHKRLLKILPQDAKIEKLETALIIG